MELFLYLLNFSLTMWLAGKLVKVTEQRYSSELLLKGSMTWDFNNQHKDEFRRMEPGVGSNSMPCVYSVGNVSKHTILAIQAEAGLKSQQSQVTSLVSRCDLHLPQCPQRSSFKIQTLGPCSDLMSQTPWGCPGICLLKTRWASLNA